MAGMATTYVLQQTTVFGAESKIFEAQRWNKMGFKTNAPKKWNQGTAVITLNPAGKKRDGSHNGSVIVKWPVIDFTIRDKQGEVLKRKTNPRVNQHYDSVSKAKKAIALKSKQMCCNYAETGGRIAFPTVYYWTDATRMKKRSRKGKKWWEW